MTIQEYSRQMAEIHAEFQAAIRADGWFDWVCYIAMAFLRHLMLFAILGTVTVAQGFPLWAWAGVLGWFIGEVRDARKEMRKSVGLPS